MAINIFAYASPARFYPLAQRLWPWFAAVAAVLTVYGLYLGLFVAPADYKQGEVYRIIFIHVPASWMSMLIYLAMAFWAVVGMIWNTRLSDMMSRALAPTGIAFTLLALWTGALWGRPTWGTYWVWDARLTTELILLFLYLGYVALRHAIDDPRRAARASALLALVGSVNVPIIYFSVKWWNTLHQGASISVSQGSSMALIMLKAMMIMVFAAWAYSIAVVLYRVCNIMLEEEADHQWVAEQMDKQ